MSFGSTLKSALLCLALSVVTIMAGCGGSGTSGGSGGAGGSGGTTTATLALSATPTSLIVTASDAFFVTVTASESGTTATPSISLGTLPAGLTTISTFPMSVPSGGATIYFATSSSIAAGSISVPVTGSAGGATATASIPLNVVSGAPNQLGFALSNFPEVQLTPGSSQSIQGSFISTNTNNPIYDVTLSVTGLPAGVTASISPQVVEPNANFTVTLTASSTALPMLNVPWNIVATSTADVPPSTSPYLLDVVARGGGAGWSNQTSYVSTRATPYSAVYDRAHEMIYAANQVWDRVDLISDKTRTVVKSISIRDPRGMDISIDGSTLWVATGSEVMYGINTTTYQATRYILPRYQASSTSPGVSWEGAQVISLADGTLLLVFSSAFGTGVQYSAIWNPAINSFTQTANPVAWGAVARSGDGKHIFSLGADEDGTSFTYDVLTGTFGAVVKLPNSGYSALAISNSDGSKVAVSGGQFSLYDGNLDLLGVLPGDGGVTGGNFPEENLFGGGIAFSPDGQTLYEETQASAVPLIIGIDVATLQPTTTSPAMPVIPTMVELEPNFYMPAPFAVDASGMVLGIEYHGIAFDDATVNLAFSSLVPSSPIFLQHMSSYSGPLAGGTTTGGFGNGFSLLPAVYYGAIQGTASLSSNSVEITSPPAISTGPVDVKMLFPDGIEVFNPQFFTYGTTIQDAIISGGSPQGGGVGQLDAFGLPIDPSHDIVTIGGKNAIVTSTLTQYPPFTGEQTAMYLSYTLPSGSPGWADLTVTTPNGTATLPKSFLFAKSVTDYSTSDIPTFVLFDNGRNQVYLSSGNHIDVFSLASNSFATPLASPVNGSQFQGLALTPDGKTLLATDLANGALAVINPDAPSSSYEIALAGSVSTTGTCNYGPLFVAPDNMGNALVTSGYVPGPTGCGYGGPSGTLYLANLTTKSAAPLNVAACGGQTAAAGALQGAHDGSLIAMTDSFRIYVPAQHTCIPVDSPPQQYTVAIAGDGNVLGLDNGFVNPSGDLLGRFASPPVLYPGPSTAFAFSFDPIENGVLQSPRMNDAGSLYFWAYPNYIDILDVQHGTSALRFGLTETVTNTVAPMAIDSDGQRIFLITGNGLTVIDLGNAPLSVGHFNQASASPGNQITVRGSGFESGISATLGGVAASLIFTDSETLTLTVPNANSGFEDLVLTNPDGASYTLQNAISVL
jgi:hypothetical protein